jgi:hypothetical protein
MNDPRLPVAKELLLRDVSVLQISHTTGLSIKEVRGLRRQWAAEARAEDRARRSKERAAERARAEELTKAVCSLALQGLSQRQIVAQTGATLPQVQRRLHDLRTKGLIEPWGHVRAKAPPKERVRVSGKRTVGNIGEMLALLTPEERAWLMAQVPVHCSIADTLAMFVRDAYDEEQERKK